MSFLGRLQDMFGGTEDYAPFENGVVNGAQQEFDPSYSPEPPQSHGNSPNNVIEMPGLNALTSELVVMEPHVFEEIPEAILALRERKTVILNLTNMDADQAQRSVDYVAGGVFAIDGHQERIGPNVFLFTPSCVQINTYASNPSGLPSPTSSFRNPFVPSANVSQTLSDRLDMQTSVSPNRPPSPRY
ncbi:MAG: cell division protein SepF [Leptolyngbyaceae bacterium]|nr:cell division protein SepF [Leptolyngbyaceae bacterium]